MFRDHLITLALICLSGLAQGQWSFSWAIHSEEVNEAQATDCAVAMDGSISVIGGYADDLDLDTFHVSETSAGLYGFLAQYDANGEFQWAHVLATTFWPDPLGSAVPAGVAVDALGNAFIGGHYGDSLVMDGTILLSNPDSIYQHSHVFYVLKFDPSGSLLWAKTISSAPNFALLSGVALDPQGDIIVAANEGDQSASIIKLSGGDGTELFHISTTGSEAQLNAVGTDALGNIYFSGASFGPSSFTFGGMTCPFNSSLGPGVPSQFAGKLDPTGSPLWFHVPNQGGQGWSDLAGIDEHRMAVTSAGFSFLLIKHPSLINGDTIGLGYQRIGMYCLDPMGNPIFARDLIAAGWVQISSLTCTTGGDVFLVGCSYGDSTALVEGPLNGSSVGSTLFLARYDGAGALTGLQSGPVGTGFSYINGVDVNMAGDPVVCGTLAYDNDIVLGPDTLICSWDMFLASMDPGPITLDVPSYHPREHFFTSPSPASDLLMVEGLLADRMLVISDLVGRTWYEKVVHASIMSIDVAAWPNGKYLIRQQGSVAIGSLLVIH